MRHTKRLPMAISLHIVVTLLAYVCVSSNVKAYTVEHVFVVVCTAHFGYCTCDIKSWHSSWSFEASELICDLMSTLSVHPSVLHH